MYSGAKRGDKEMRTSRTPRWFVPAMVSLVVTAVARLYSNELSIVERSTNGLPLDDGLFYDLQSRNPNQLTVRAACDLVDDEELAAQQKDSGSTALYEDCMNALKDTYRLDRASHGSCKSPDALFHAFWASKEPLPDDVKLGMLSTVYSQQKCAKLQVWTTSDESRIILRDALAPYGSDEYFSVEILNLTDIVEKIRANFPSLNDVLHAKQNLISDLDSSVSSSDDSNDGKERQNQQTRYSDMLRVFLLAAHGGVYVEVEDVLLLRNLKPLLQRDFYYRWSTLPFANTAVFHLRYQSPNAEKLVRYGLVASDTVRQLCHSYHPKAVYEIITEHGGDVELLPSTYMDPHWVLVDTDNNLGKNMTFFSSGLYDWSYFFSTHPAPTTSVETFFPGVFAYHWHSQNSKAIGKNSVADIFLKKWEEVRETGRFA